MIPFFILVWALIMYVHSARMAMLGAYTEARTSAWLAANAACPAGEGAPLGGDGLAEIRRRAAGGSDPTFIDELERIPFLGAVLRAIFGTNVYRTASRNINKPRVLGGGHGTTTGEFMIMCNERRRDMGDVARDTFCAVPGTSFFCE